MITDQATTPRPFLALSTLFLVLGLAGFWLSWHVFPPVLTVPLVLIVICAGLSEIFAFSLPIFSVSLAYPLAMGAVILGGPAAACVVAAASSVNPSDIRRHRPASILAFNIGQVVLSTALGGLVYLGLGGRVLHDPVAGYRPLTASDFPGVLAAMTGAAVVCSVFNLVATSLGVAVYQKQAFRRVFASASAFAPTQVALAFVGFLMAQVLAINAWALVLFAFPLVVARQLYQRYVGLREAYSDTVRSFVHALEAKDPYTRGHSERVARYSHLIGEALGLEEKALERLEYAALLHDLGKLSLPTGLLTKPSRLTEDEYLAVRQHPLLAASMVRQIPPLRELADLVSQHHERFDGAGYPSGLAGADISPLARILAVADAFDAMTTDRAYRPALGWAEAVAELGRGAGSQFDPGVVDRAVRALCPEACQELWSIERVEAQPSRAEEVEPC